MVCNDREVGVSWKFGQVYSCFRLWLPLGLMHFMVFGGVWGLEGSELRRRYTWSEMVVKGGSDENFPMIPLFWDVAPIRAHAFCRFWGGFRVWGGLG